MAGSTKRTRSTSNNDDSDHPARDRDHAENNDQPPSSTPSRRRHAAASSTSTQPSQPPSTPPRPILTRSATTLTTQPPLTRSNSMFLPSRRAGTLSGLSTPSLGSALGPPSASSSNSRVGTLTRTQSTPSMASPAQLKAAVAGGSGGPGRGKGEGDDDFETRDAKRGGRGKENIPPKKDEENDENGSRKRMRVGRRSSAASLRGRSGSVSSMRSEGPPGMCTRLRLQTRHLHQLAYPPLPPRRLLAFRARRGSLPQHHPCPPSRHHQSTTSPLSRRQLLPATRPSRSPRTRWTSKRPRPSPKRVRRCIRLRLCCRLLRRPVHSRQAMMWHSRRSGWSSYE